MQQWIKTGYRAITDSERIEKSYPDQACYIVTGRLPDEGQEITVLHQDGIRESNTIFHADDGIYLENDWDWIKDVRAWMPRNNNKGS